jgi:hypothetical protein
LKTSDIPTLILLLTSRMSRMSYPQLASFCIAGRH